MPDFIAFNKIPRWSRNIIITEKIDGANASILITQDGEFYTASRTRWIKPGDDNFGFSKWAHDHKDELLLLGPGHHFGEWWGKGIQRGYDLPEKRFSLFNVSRWDDNNIPSCCHVVPTLYQGANSEAAINGCITKLALIGSAAKIGFMRPEGIVIFHTAANHYFKKTIVNDESPKCQTP